MKEIPSNGVGTLDKQTNKKKKKRKLSSSVIIYNAL